MLMSWNCEVLCGYEDLMIQRLRDMRKQYFPDILFIMETIHSIDYLVNLQEWLGYDRIYTVNPIGKSDGLALF